MFIHKTIPSYTDEEYTSRCCPVFYPERWDRHYFDFSELYFVKFLSKTLFLKDINYKHAYERIKAIIEIENAAGEHKKFVLSKDISNFERVNYILVNANIRSFPLEKVKGVYYARVFEGKVDQLVKWKKEIEEEWRTKGKRIMEQFVFTTNCAVCSKKNGHNYIVIFTR